MNVRQGVNVLVLRKSMTKKGNAVGFNKEGATVCCYYLPTSKSWIVGLTLPLAETESYSRRFGTQEEAALYAASLLNVEQTKRLAWWNVSRLLSSEVFSS